MPELRENAHLSKLLETRFGLQFVQYENWRIPDGRYCSILYDSYRRPHRRAAPPRTGEGVSSTDVGSLRHLAGAYRYLTLWCLPRVKGAAIAVMWHLGLRGDETQ